MAWHAGLVNRIVLRKVNRQGAAPQRPRNPVWITLEKNNRKGPKYLGHDCVWHQPTFQEEKDWTVLHLSAANAGRISSCPPARLQNGKLDPGRQRKPRGGSGFRECPNREIFQSRTAAFPLPTSLEQKTLFETKICTWIPETHVAPIKMDFCVPGWWPESRIKHSGTRVIQTA